MYHDSIQFDVNTTRIYLTAHTILFNDNFLNLQLIVANVGMCDVAKTWDNLCLYSYSGDLDFKSRRCQQMGCCMHGRECYISKSAKPTSIESIWYKDFNLWLKLNSVLNLNGSLLAPIVIMHNNEYSIYYTPEVDLIFCLIDSLVLLGISWWHHSKHSHTLAWHKQYYPILILTILQKFYCILHFSK